VGGLAAHHFASDDTLGILHGNTALAAFNVDDEGHDRDHQHQQEQDGRSGKDSPGGRAGLLIEVCDAAGQAHNDAGEDQERKPLRYTLGLLAVYRIGGHIPTPGINGDRLAQFFEQNKGSVLGFVDLFSGGNLRRLTIFALGIMPYITASIILQLLTVVYEPLAKLQKEGEMGRKKITMWTRYLT